MMNMFVLFSCWYIILHNKYNDLPHLLIVDYSLDNATV